MVDNKGTSDSGYSYHNYQLKYDIPLPESGGKITSGSIYTFTYTLKSNVAIKNNLEVFLVDNSGDVPKWWRELSDEHRVIGSNIRANEEVMGTITFLATGTASSTAKEANRLVIEVPSVADAAGKPTLTFTRFGFHKGGSGSGGSGGGGGGGTAYTIYYDRNGADSYDSSISFSETFSGVTEVRLRTGADLHRYSAGLNFQCWNTSPDGYGYNYTAGSKYTFNSDITLYARWRQPLDGEKDIILGRNTGNGFDQWQGYFDIPQDLRPIVDGNIFKLVYTFTSNVRITDKLEICLVYHTPGNWNELSSFVPIGENIPAGNTVTGLKTIAANGTASTIDDYTNQLIFRINKIEGADGEPILTFTQFDFTREE